MKQTYFSQCLFFMDVYMRVCVSFRQTPPGLSPQATSIVSMAVSFSYKYLALFTDSGHVWMGSSNLKVRQRGHAQPGRGIYCSYRSVVSLSKRWKSL